MMRNIFLLASGHSFEIELDHNEHISPSPFLLNLLFNPFRYALSDQRLGKGGLKGPPRYMAILGPYKAYLYLSIYLKPWQLNYEHSNMEFYIIIPIHCQVLKC